MGELLVSRPDVGEFRRRYKWLALGAFLAFVAVCVRLFQLQVVSGADYAAIAHENIVKRVSVATNPRRHPRRLRQDPGVEPSRPTTSTSSPVARCRARVPSIAGATPKSRTASARSPRRSASTPDERTQLEAKMRAACEYDDDHSPLLAPDPGSRRSRPRHRRRGEAAPGGAGRRRGGRLAGPLLPVQEPGRAPPRLRGRDRRRHPRQVPPHRRRPRHRRRRAVSRGPAEAQSARLRARATRSEPPASSDPGRASCAVNGAGRSASSTPAVATAPVPRPTVSSTVRNRPARPRRQDPIAGRDLRLTVDIELEQAIDKIMRGHAAGAVVVTRRALGAPPRPSYSNPRLRPERSLRRRRPRPASARSSERCTKMLCGPCSTRP